MRRVIGPLIAAVLVILFCVSALAQGTIFNCNAQYFFADGSISSGSNVFTSSYPAFSTSTSRIAPYIAIVGAGGSPFYVYSGTIGSSGGSSNVIGDTLTVTTGTGTAAQFLVATVSSGAVLTVTEINAGSYTVNPTTSNVATTSSNVGATPPNMNLVMFGATLSGTITGYISNNTVTLSVNAGNTVTNTTKWGFGADNAGYFNAQATSVILPTGNCGVITAVKPQPGVLFVGEGFQTQIVALANIATAPLEMTGNAAPLPGGGGFENITIDALDLAPYACYIHSPTRHMNFSNVSCKNGTTTDWLFGDGGITTVAGNWYSSIEATNDTYFSIGQWSANNILTAGQTDSFLIDPIASNATGTANIQDNTGGNNHYLHPHCFGVEAEAPGGLATYCIQIKSSTTVTQSELDSFNTAGIRITGSANTVIGGKVVNGGAALAAVSFAAGAKNNVVMGMVNPNATPGNTIVSDTTLDPSNIVIANPGASLASLGAGLITVPQGRLTLISGNVVMNGDFAGATTIYYQPYTGWGVPVYQADNGAMVEASIGQFGISLALDATTTDPGFQVAGTVADLFVAYNGSTPVLCTGPYWTETSTVTITIANPAVVTYTGHGLAAGAPIVFSTTGTLPTGITAGTTYYLVPTIATNTFEISATQGGAAVVTSGSQTGTQTAVAGYNVTGKIPARGTGPGTTELAQTISGIWTNAHQIACRYGSATGSTLTMPLNNGTWVGSAHFSANGQVTEQFGSASSYGTDQSAAAAAGGRANEMGLCNGYNTVPYLSGNQDINAVWTNTSSTWVVADALNSATGNVISELDCAPLGQQYVQAKYSVTAIEAAGAVCQIGVSRNSMTVAPILATIIAGATYETGFITEPLSPLLGFNYYQAMERDQANAGTCTFNRLGTSEYLQLEAPG